MRAAPSAAALLPSAPQMENRSGKPTRFVGARNLLAAIPQVGDSGRRAPAGRILAETDCPFLPPQGKRGQRNEPSAVGEVIRSIALARNIPEEILILALLRF